MEIDDQFRDEPGEDAEVEGEIVESDFIFPQWYEYEFGEIMAKQNLSQSYMSDLMRNVHSSDFRLQADNLATIKP